jgi:hypothetical protein
LGLHRRQLRRATPADGAAASRRAAPEAFATRADITLRIAEITLDLGLSRSVKTIAYNGQVPGPRLAARVGRPVTVDVYNDTRDEDIVHWHGLHVPPEVDGVYDRGRRASLPAVAASVTSSPRSPPVHTGNNVEKVVVLAPTRFPPAVSVWTYPMNITDKRDFFIDWDRQIDSKNCPQQVDPSIRQALWNSTIALDKLGSGWGASGVRRSPAFTAAGWTPDLPGRVQAPTLVIRGALDDQAPSQRHALSTTRSVARRPM